MYSAADGGPVARHEPETGDRDWEYNRLDSAKWGLQVDDDGNVYVGNSPRGSDGEQVHRIAPTGWQAWTFTDFDGIADEMAIDDEGHIYAGDDSVLRRIAQPIEGTSAGRSE